LAGPPALEERLADPKMESFSQRIAVRAYLEPLDHAETVAYLQTQTRAAGLEWGRCFEPGCEDAVYTTADGVPRLMNQICDQALVLVAGADRRVRPSDIAAAWQEIQRLPSPMLFGHIVEGETRHDAAAVGPATGRDHHDHGEGRPGWSDAGRPEDDASAAYGGDGGVGVIEFGPLEDRPSGIGMRPLADIGELVGTADEEQACGGRVDPWRGPDVEFVFDASADPFQEFFEQEERIVERYLVRSADDFSRHLHVSSGEGAALVRQLAEVEERRDDSDVRPGERPPSDRDAAAREACGTDDDMVVIEEDLLVPTGVRPTVAAVRLGDYRRLFARLRRGG
jgi:hypothetical protein